MSQEVRKRIAQKLKYYREIHSYTREALSLSLGFENSYIGKVERAKVNITIDRLNKIANFFNIDIIELFN